MLLKHRLVQKYAILLELNVLRSERRIRFDEVRSIWNFRLVVAVVGCRLNHQLGRLETLVFGPDPEFTGKGQVKSDQFLLLVTLLWLSLITVWTDRTCNRKASNGQTRHEMKT